MAVPPSAYIKTLQPRLEVPREKLGCADSLPLRERSTEKDRHFSFKIRVAVLMDAAASSAPRSCLVAEAAQPSSFPQVRFWLSF